MALTAGPSADLSAEPAPEDIAAAVRRAPEPLHGGPLALARFGAWSGLPAVVIAAVVSLAAHFAVGAAKSLITIRSWWSSGLEMTFVGALEGAVTYAIGLALGRIGA